MTIFDLLHYPRTGASSPYDRGREVPDVGHGAHPAAATRFGGDLCDVPGWLSQYREDFPVAAINCPAELLGQPGVVAAVVKHGHAVDVRSLDELDLAISLGIQVARIVVHDDGRTAAPIRCGVNAGVGLIVMARQEQIKLLANCVERPQRILVDITAGGADTTIGAVFACRRLDLVGLHARLAPGAGLTEYVDAVARMVAQMAWIRGHRDVILTRVSLEGGAVVARTTVDRDALRALSAALEDAFDDACARFRFPRPALILAPGVSSTAQPAAEDHS
ncbi:MAG: lysA [Mycobacterium sp.]|nr:lysA [Mycobacterium sp.]